MKHDPLKPRYMRASTLAKYLGVEPQSIKRWQKTPGFPTRYKLGPRSLLYRIDEVEAWVANQREQF